MSESEGRSKQVRTGAKALGGRILAPVGAITVLALLLLGVGSAAACPPSAPPAPTVLATIPLVATVAANSSMVFAQGVTNCSEIWGISPSGSVAVYATIPNVRHACEEGALTLAPGPSCPSNGTTNASVSPRAGEWGNHGGGSQGCSRCASPTGDVLYDALNGVLYSITNGGANVTSLARFAIPFRPSENMGLTYDSVGSFAHDLIVTSSSDGKVWSYNLSTGQVTLLATLGTYIAGPAVAPTGFGSYGGDILVGAKYMNRVDAISPSGNVSKVADWGKPNAVAFPSSGSSNGGWGGFGNGCGAGCSFGRNHDVLFVTNYSSGAVEGFSQKDLQGFGGDGMVAGGLNQGIAGFSSSGSTKLFLSQTQRLSDISFISCFPQSYGRGGGSGGWLSGTGTD